MELEKGKWYYQEPENEWLEYWFFVTDIEEADYQGLQILRTTKSNILVEYDVIFFGSRSLDLISSATEKDLKKIFSVIFNSSIEDAR